MGYRSEVAFVVSPKALPLLMAKLAGCENTLQMVFTDFDSLDTDFGGDGSLLVQWSYIKWYDSYKGIHVIESFLDELDDKDMEEEYGFIRVGESMDDNVQRGCFGEMYISRTISFH